MPAKQQAVCCDESTTQENETHTGRLWVEATGTRRRVRERRAGGRRRNETYPARDATGGRPANETGR
jgi:hypothetical protein